MKNINKDAFSEAKQIPKFKSVLDGWLNVQRQYIEESGDDDSERDAPWYHRERASVGFLAAGAWQAKGVALEEWHTDKGAKDKPKKGRCDLWLYNKRTKLELFIEAKFMYSRATGNRDKEIGYIEKKLTEAASDAKKLQCPESQKLGILFLVPSYPIGRQSDISEHLPEWLSDVYSIKHAAIAWLFPARDLGRPHLPGIVLIARQPQ